MLMNFLTIKRIMVVKVAIRTVNLEGEKKQEVVEDEVRGGKSR